MIFDVQIAQYFAQIQGQYAWLDSLMIFLAEFLPWLLGAMALWSAYNKYRRQISDFVFVGLSAVVARFGINELIYLFIKNPRPMDLGYPALIASQPNPSFPSGHASFLFAMSFAVFLSCSKNNGLVLLFLSALCLVARMYCGAHFLSDILAGVGIGMFCAWVLWQGYFKKKTVIV
jgi:undecaprenyl-diphosphatase